MTDETGTQTEDQQFKQDHTASNRVGVTLSQSVEGNIIAELMEEKEGVEVTHFPAMIRIDTNNRLEFDLEEITEAIGDIDEFTAYDFQVEMATHYGRMVADDEKVVLYANPEDAAEELGFDLLEKAGPATEEGAEEKK
jgi:propane monooxygenase coupling protein